MKKKLLILATLILASSAFVWVFSASKNNIYSKNNELLSPSSSSGDVTTSQTANEQDGLSSTPSSTPQNPIIPPVSEDFYGRVLQELASTTSPGFLYQVGVYSSSYDSTYSNAKPDAIVIVNSDTKLRIIPGYGFFFHTTYAATSDTYKVIEAHTLWTSGSDQ